MSELYKLGRHCALDSCHRLDFLPFDCDQCHLSFCLDHRTPHTHSCTAPAPPQPQPVSLAKLSHMNPHRCSEVGCRRRELTANHCRNCGNNYCLAHRFPTQHACNAQLGRNVIRPKGATTPATSTLLLPAVAVAARDGAGCAAEERKERDKGKSNNTNVAAQSRLLQQAQRAH